MLLYHGFRNFEKILEKDKLQANRLITTKTLPSTLYAFPSLIVVAGDKLLEESTFNVGKLIIDYDSDIISAAKNRFNQTILDSHLRAFGIQLLNNNPESNISFYRSNAIFFSPQPVGYTNYLVMDVPDKLIQNSPQHELVVAGELSLEHAVGLHIKKGYESIINDILQTTNRVLPIKTYE